jgi:hypothetical protein
VRTLNVTRKQDAAGKLIRITIKPPAGNLIDEVVLLPDRVHRWRCVVGLVPVRRWPPRKRKDT